jgi:replicative DNA helicase
MRPGKLEDQDWPLISAAAAKLNSKSIFVDDAPAPTISHIVQQARSMHFKYGIKAIYIDYLQRVKGNGESRRVQVGGIAQTLKELARELDIPVIALAQLNRESETRADPTPKVADLKESGDIEQEADTIMLLHRPQDREGVMEIIIGKNRHGEQGKFDFGWKGENLKVYDFAEGY